MSKKLFTDGQPKTIVRNLTKCNQYYNRVFFVPHNHDYVINCLKFKQAIVIVKTNRLF